jgi:rhodanese-related sulfurtransferase
MNFFEMCLEFQTDVSDVERALSSGDPGFVLVDARNAQAWEQGRIPGAIRLEDARLDPAVPVVTYCWGPGCNGATKAAAELTRRGFRVREMIGGIEYWIREGFPVRTDTGDKLGEPDPLTAPVRAVDCGC